MTATRTVIDLVEQFRATAVRGHVVDLLPYADAHHTQVLALRNLPRPMYFLHQPDLLTLAGQTRWFAGYLERRDDIQWVIARKDGTVLGATALYDIAADRSHADKGRLVIDESRSMEAPYVLEAELLLLDVATGQTQSIRRLLDVAFARLGIARIDTCVRHDNAGMQSINARLGFTPGGSHDVRGVEYLDFSVTAEQHHPEALRRVAAAWAARTNRLTGVSV